MRCIGILLFGASCAFAPCFAERPLPVSPAPFETSADQTKRYDGVFYTDLFSYYHGGSKPVSLRFTRGNWRCGEKTVTTGITGDDAKNEIGERHAVHVLLRGKPLARFNFGGASGAPGMKDSWGSPYKEIPGDPSVSSTDEANETIRWEKPYIDVTGERRVFFWTVRSLGAGRFRLDWDRGLTDEQFAAQKGEGQLLFFAKFMTENPRQVVVKDGTCSFHADNPCEGIVVSGFDGTELLPDAPRFDYRGEKVESFCRFRKNAPRGSILIDLLESRPAKPTPPPVNGLDFWAEDATHVPLRPTRNQLRNPSFEEGLRYWTWDRRAYISPELLASGVERVELTTETAAEGRTALRFPAKGGGCGLISFPLATKPGATYTFSFSARREPGLSDRRLARVRLFSPTARSPLEFDKVKASAFELTDEWTRHSCSVKSDGTGLVVQLNGCGTLFDAVQLEEGSEATPWAGDPVTGVLKTSDSDNILRGAAPWSASLRLTGSPKSPVTVRCRVGNVYRETLLDIEKTVTFDEDGVACLPLDFDGADLGNGVFVLRTDYTMKGGSGSPLTWTTYQRCERLRPHDGTHPTRTIVATLASDLETTGRLKENWRRWKEWGIGATTWGRSYSYDQPGSVRAQASAEIGLVNFFRPVDEHEEIRGDKGKGIPSYLDWDEVTPEREKLIEETAYRVVSGADPKLYTYWALGNEEEGSKIVRRAKGQTRIGQEYSKAQLAARRGVLRANPKAKVMPSSGPCNYSPSSNAREAVEAYIREAALKGVKWDAIGVHPYGLLDGSTIGKGDLDEAIRALFGLMDKYDYPKTTPLVFVEGFNVPPQVVKEWGSGPNNDWYRYGHAGYDFTQRELVHAGALVRTYLMCLKYWPRLKTINTWTQCFHMDPQLVPTACPDALNGFGHRLPDVAFVGDATPYPGIFAYVFRRKTDGKAVAALWTSDNAVEYGFQRGTSLMMKLPTDTVAYDAYDTRRRIVRSDDGTAEIPLTPLPLYLEASDAEALLAAAKSAGRDAASIRREEDAAKPSANVLTVVAPRRENLDCRSVASVDLDRAVGLALGRPRKLITGPADFSAKARVCWNGEALKIRVEAKDDEFLLNETLAQDPERVRNQLYSWDGCLEVYFDCFNNGKSNVLNDFDTDDYRYDFAPPVDGRTGRGRVWRLREVDHQLANGLNMPKKEDAERNVVCNFERTPDGYVYEVVFPAEYLQPLRLEKGTTVGFGLYLHDRDGDDPAHAEVGVTLMNDYTGVCDHNPKGWAQLRLE